MKTTKSENLSFAPEEGRDGIDRWTSNGYGIKLIKVPKEEQIIEEEKTNSDVLSDCITLDFWKRNRQQLSTKSFVCHHNGYTYGDGMKFSKLTLFYNDIENNASISLAGDKANSKTTYIRFVEFLCNQSVEIFKRFRSRPEKFKVFSKDEVLLFTEKNKTSTRINKGKKNTIQNLENDQSCISIGGEAYFVANNLKICEYFNNIVECLNSKELAYGIIKIEITKEKNTTIIDTSENEEIFEGKRSNQFYVNLQQQPENTHNNKRNSLSRTVVIDYEKLYHTRKMIGDLGEQIILDYEIRRLQEAKRPDLAQRIEHTSLIKGDGAGYDILSYTCEGTPLFIEVKTTKQAKPFGFYISKREKEVAEEMFKAGIDYKIYRVYSLNIKKGTCNLVIFSQPFDQFKLIPNNWLVEGV